MNNTNTNTNTAQLDQLQFRKAMCSYVRDVEKRVKSGSFHNFDVDASNKATRGAAASAGGERSAQDRNNVKVLGQTAAVAAGASESGKVRSSGSGKASGDMSIRRQKSHEKSDKGGRKEDVMDIVKYIGPLPLTLTPNPNPNPYP
jgi:hypothetical protein